MAKKKLSVQDMAAREVGRACQVLEELLRTLYGTDRPEYDEGGVLGEQLGDLVRALDDLQMHIGVGDFGDLSTVLIEQAVIVPPKGKKKSKSASAGK